MCNELGRRTLLAKIDLKNAFRQCPVQVQDWHLLGIHWANNFYFDKCLPFGLRSAPHHFDSVATALEYIIKEHTNSPHVIHYLDDFLFAGPPGCDTCTTVFTVTKALCARLGITIKLEKCVVATTCITFLGIELDTVAQVARLPRDKLVELLAELQTFVERKRCTKRELLSIVGKLVFASKVIPAGRIFVRQLLDSSRQVSALHHRIHLNKETKADLMWWLEFARNWNGQGFFLEDFQLYTDAAGTTGFGAYWASQWLCDTWHPHQQLHTIEWKEMFAVVVAALAWGHMWVGKRLLVHCDNHAVVDIWQSGKSRNPQLMALVRRLFFIAAVNNFHIVIQHISGTDNSIADSLSRLQMDRFWRLAPLASATPTPIPAQAMSL